ncbi:MAG TPA: RNA polymerase sigma factor [Aggregatilineales bacterium]|nr:RNA polymerase sigma factor [Aggregatilineales bacterium]
MDSKREQKLIRAAQRGDERAFGELYNAHVHDIYRYMLYRVGTPEVAQDLTAEVFLRAIEGLVRYQDREIPWLAWLYRIAHARVVDHYRRSRHYQNQEDIDSLEITADHDLDSDLLTSFQQQKLKDALLRLSDDQQQVIILRFIQGYNIQQTADVLGKSIGAIKMIQRRALQAMKAELTRQGMRSDGTD